MADRSSSAPVPTSKEALKRIKEKVQKYAGSKITVTVCEPLKMYKAKASDGTWEFLGFSGFFTLLIDRVLGGTFIIRAYDATASYKLRFEQEVFVGMEVLQLTPQFLAYQTGSAYFGFAFPSPAVCKKVASRLKSAVANQQAETKSITIVKKKENAFDKFFGGIKKVVTDVFKPKDGKGGSGAAGAGGGGGGGGDIRILNVESTITLDPNGGIDTESLPKQWRDFFKKKNIKKKELRDPEIAKEVIMMMRKANAAGKGPFGAEEEEEDTEDIDSHVQAPARPPKPPGRKTKPPPPAPRTPNRGTKPTVAAPPPAHAERNSERVDKETLLRTFRVLKNSGAAPRATIEQQLRDHGIDPAELYAEDDATAAAAAAAAVAATASEAPKQDKDQPPKPGPAPPPKKSTAPAPAPAPPKVAEAKKDSPGAPLAAAAAAAAAGGVPPPPPSGGMVAATSPSSTGAPPPPPPPPMAGGGGGGPPPPPAAIVVGSGPKIKVSAKGRRPSASPSPRGGGGGGGGGTGGGLMAAIAGFKFQKNRKRFTPKAAPKAEAEAESNIEAIIRARRTALGDEDDEDEDDDSDWTSDEE